MNTLIRRRVWLRYHSGHSLCMLMLSLVAVGKTKLVNVSN